MKGYVYLINDSGKENAYKIGVTKNLVTERKKELQTGNSSDLNIVTYFETKYPYKLEAMLHRYYSQTNIKNEWFNLTDDEVSGFIQLCEKLNNVILSIENNPFFNKF